MANIGLIGRYGPVWFREVGAPDAPGTTLLTVSGAVSRPGIYEIPLGTRVDRVLTGAGADSGIAAVLLGGYGARGWDRSTSPRRSPRVRWRRPVRLSAPVSWSPSRRRAAAWPRRHALPTGWRGERRTVRTVCVRAPAIAEDLTLLAAGRSSHSVLERLCHRLDEVEGRGACGHPDGVVRIVRSALSVFADDLASHLRSGPCPGSRAHTVLALPGRDGGPWR